MTTDATGGYGAAVAAGTYDVRCSRTGYVTQTRTGIVIPADTLVVVNFTMLQTPGITGRVTSATTRAAIADATIDISQGGVILYTTTTGPGGDYSIETDPGTYTVACSAAGYVDQTRTGVVVTSAGLTTANFALADSAQIRGTITRALDGAPLEGALIRLYEQRTGRLLRSVLSAADGTYAVDRNLASGTVSVEVSLAGYVSQGALVTLNAGQTYALDFALVLAPTRVEGIITRYGTTTKISGARVAAYQGGVLRASANSNLLGGYSLVLPGPGDYTLLITATSYIRQENPLSISSGDRLTRNFALRPFSGNSVTLSGGGVDPTSGVVGDIFRYTVTYQQQWGKSPVRAYLYIDGRLKYMTLASGDAYTGAVYQYSATLAAGAHRYYFSFYDGRSTKRLPASGSYLGPTVTNTLALGAGATTGGTTTTTPSGGGLPSGGGDAAK